MIRLTGPAKRSQASPSVHDSTPSMSRTSHRPDQLISHLRLALANGLTQDELVEALTHLACYAGWPFGMAALTQLKMITAETGSGPSR